MKVFLLAIMLMLLTQCGSVEPVVQKPSLAPSELKEMDSDLEEKSKAYFTDNYAILENTPKDYVIVFKKFKKMTDLMANIRYFIYKKEDNIIIFEDELQAGTVRWEEDYMVLAVSRNNNPTGVPGVAATVRYEYDVLTRKKSFIE